MSRRECAHRLLHRTLPYHVTEKTKKHAGLARFIDEAMSAEACMQLP